MDGQNEQLYQEWSGRQWAAEDPAQDHDSTQRWTADEWVGDQGRASEHLTGPRPRWLEASGA